VCSSVSHSKCLQPTQARHAHTTFHSSLARRQACWEHARRPRICVQSVDSRLDPSKLFGEFYPAERSMQWHVVHQDGRCLTRILLCGVCCPWEHRMWIGFFLCHMTACSPQQWCLGSHVLWHNPRRMDVNCLSSRSSVRFGLTVG
jgi:hypothetical protein